MDKKDILKQIDLCLEYYQCSILFDRYNIQQSIGFENLDICEVSYNDFKNTNRIKYCTFKDMKNDKFNKAQYKQQYDGYYPGLPLNFNSWFVLEKDGKFIFYNKIKQTFLYLVKQLFDKNNKLIEIAIIDNDDASLGKANVFFIGEQQSYVLHVTYG